MRNVLRLFGAKNDGADKLKSENKDNRVLHQDTDALALQLTRTEDTNAAQHCQENDHPVVLDAVIIGAGWAGLGAGLFFWDQSRKKKQDDFQFCILEAHDAIGGRSKTKSPISDEYPNSMMEVGSQWIHGAHRRNRVYQLALKQNMILHYDQGDGEFDSAAVWVDKEVDSSKDSSSYPSQEGRRRILERVDSELEKELESRLLDPFYNFLFNYPCKAKKQWKKDHRNDATAPKKPPPVSIQEVFEIYCQKKNLSPEDKKYLHYLLEMDFTQEYSASLEDIDAEYCDHDKEYSGGDLHFGIWEEKADRGNVQGGYSALIHTFAQPLIEDNDLIRGNCKVTSIDTSDDPVVIEYEQTKTNNDPEDGESTTSHHRILAHSVLCTVPLGVLKADTIQFRPTLPAVKSQAIQKLGMGTYNKVAFVWNHDQRHQLPWLFPMGDQQAKEDDDKIGGKATCKIWLERVSLPGEPQGAWSCCYTALTHQSPNSPIVLYFFLGGRLAREIESLSNEETQQQALDALRDWFEDPNIPNPQEMIVTRWSQDPLTRGSYSFYQVGSSPKDRKDLARPLPNKRLFFAGEACHIKYYATTHGALMSGQDAGQAMWKNDLIMKKHRRRRRSSTK